MTLSNTHFVTVVTPNKGADYYAILCKESYTTFIAFIAVKGKVLAHTEKKVPFVHFVQGRVPDKIGNKEIHHSYLEGQITVLPHTDKVWSFKPKSTSNQSTTYSQTTRELILEKSWKASNLVDLASTPSTGWPMRGLGGNTHYNFDMVDSKKRYHGEDRRCRFFFDLSNLDKSKAIVSTRVYGPEYDYTYDSTYDCSAIYLGKVIDSTFDDTILRTEVEKVLTTNAPTTFLTDLYDKLGTPQVNNYGNIAAAKKWREMVPPVLALIKKRNIKSVADLYLWWKYSYSTSKMDIESYVEWFRSLSKQKTNPTNGTHYSLTYTVSHNDVIRYNIYLTPYSIGVLEALGLDINFTNTWDLIPFSFVVDWFVSIGDTLKSLDVADLEAKVNLTSLLTSRKSTKVFVPIGNSQIAGDLTSHYYKRTISNTLPRDVCDLHFNNPSSHLLDGTSLFISCKRK